jgi:8-oxo-dGTP pyrophosphatase MutT (NUDIX family)
MVAKHDSAEVIQAAGGLLWRDAPRGRELLVIHRARYDDWTLPKGKLRPGERWQEAAVREVAEETGYQAQVIGAAGSVRYTVRGVPKVVRFWHMGPLGASEFRPSEEVAEIQWLAVDEAIRRLTYPKERDLVQRAIREEAEHGNHAGGT